MADVYKIIEQVKEVATARTADGVTVLTPKDMIGKIEFENGQEDYKPGYTDYHEYR